MNFLNEDKSKLVKNVFNKVYDKYDLMNDIMSLGTHRIWKKNLISWVNPNKGSKILDVASGTGDIAKLYLEKINYNGQVDCVDENMGMLNLSKEKFKNQKYIKWFCNNAQKLPFKDNYFDYYTISFGIRNIENIPLALKEAYRVLKPGGKFSCLEFSKVNNIILNKFYQIYSKSIPKIGKIVIGKSEPYKYLIESIEKFYSQEELFYEIKKQNFTSISFKNLSGGVVAIHSAWKV